MSKLLRPEPTKIEDYRPAGNQFSLRGMFLVMTVSCVMLAVLALVMRNPQDWLGALLVPGICLAIILALELGRVFFPPKPHFHNYLPPLPQNPLQTDYFSERLSPFTPGSPFATTKTGEGEPKKATSGAESPMTDSGNGKEAN